MSIAPDARPFCAKPARRRDAAPRSGSILIALALFTALAAQPLAADPPPADDDAEAPAVPPEDSPAGASDSAREQLLSTVGTLAAAQLYQAYLTIGFIADASKKQSYAQKQLDATLGSVLSLLETLDKELEKIGGLELSESDRGGLEKLTSLSSLLRSQGDELRTYWKTRSKATLAEYTKHRDESWAGLKSLLGLEGR